MSSQIVPLPAVNSTEAIRCSFVLASSFQIPFVAQDVIDFWYLILEKSVTKGYENTK